MNRMTEAEIQAAMDQINNCVVSIKLHRLTPDEIETYNRPRRRNAKKRYLSLDFADDNEYFLKACNQENWFPEKKFTRKKRKVENFPPPAPSLIRRRLSDLLVSDDEEENQTPVDCKTDLPAAFLCAKLEEELPFEKLPVKVEMEFVKDEPKDTLTPRIRVKSAAELGSSIIFIDAGKGCDLSATISPNTNLQHALSDFISNKIGGAKQSEGVATTGSDVHAISSVYREFFTWENRKIIKQIVAVLQNLTESIKKKNDRLTEINNSRSTDAEKLMLRHQAHGEFNRMKMTNQATLKELFEAMDKNYKKENFEIQFQLFFLGILKIFILSVSNKKGTLFKKIVSLLLQSLTSSNYRNERVLDLLKSKDFRQNCINLVDLIEKYSGTKFFNPLLLSEVEKTVNPKTDKSADTPSIKTEDANSSAYPNRPAFSVEYASDLNIVPVGNNLFLRSFNENRSALDESKLSSSVTEKNSTAAAIRPSILCKRNDNQARSQNSAADGSSCGAAKALKFALPHPTIAKTINAPKSVRNAAASDVSSVSHSSSCNASLSFNTTPSSSYGVSPATHTNVNCPSRPRFNERSSTFSDRHNVPSNMVVNSTPMPMTFQQRRITPTVPSSSFAPNVTINSAFPANHVIRTQSVIVPPVADMSLMNNTRVTSPAFNLTNQSSIAQNGISAAGTLVCQSSNTTRVNPISLNAENKSNAAQRNYASAKDMNRMKLTGLPAQSREVLNFLPIPTVVSSSYTSASEYPTLSTLNTQMTYDSISAKTAGNRMTLARNPCEGNNFPPYQLTNSATNNENIQPQSQNVLQNTYAGKDVNYHVVNFTPAHSNVDNVSLRSLLLNERTLVNQNGLPNASCQQYCDKSNYSSSSPAPFSSNSMMANSLIPNHGLVTNFVGNNYPC